MLLLSHRFFCVCSCHIYGDPGSSSGRHVGFERKIICYYIVWLFIYLDYYYTVRHVRNLFININMAHGENSIYCKHLKKIVMWASLSFSSNAMFTFIEKFCIYFIFNLIRKFDFQLLFQVKFIVFP